MNFFKVLRFLLLLNFFGVQATFSQENETTYIRKPSFYDTLPALKKGGSLSYRIASDPKVMNPILSADAESSSLEGFLWMSLMTLDPDTLAFLPALAKGYSVSSDRKQYTFFLEPAAKWQDDTPVTADDIVFTFNTIMNPKTFAAAQRSYYSGISVAKIDTHTVVFSVEEPRFDTLFVLSVFVPIQKKQFEHSTDFNKDPAIMNPIGNGPYIFKKYERGQGIIFELNKNWWAHVLPHYKNRFNIEKIELKIINDHNLSYEKFLKGQIHSLDFTSEQWHTKVKGIDHIKFGENSKSGKEVWALQAANKYPRPYSYVGWNFKNPIFKDKNTRKALSMLVNYPKIINHVYFGLSEQTTSPFGSFTKNSDPTLGLPENIMTFDKKAAKKILRESGWKKKKGEDVIIKEIDGKETVFEFDLNIASISPTAPKIAQIIKEDLSKFGIQVNIKALEWNTFLDKIEKRDFDAVLLGWTSTLFPNAKQIWHSSSVQEGGSNHIGYSNPEVDALITASNMEFDPDKRFKIMQKINRIIYDDQPYTFIAEPKYVLEGLNKSIHSPRWISAYEGGAASDLFYVK